MLQIRAAFGRFFAVRGTHLAAMVAYFALASFVPLVFLALALLGLFGRVDESTALVSYLEDVFPGRSVEQIVRIVGTVQDNARTLGIVGGVALLWSSLSLFSALESAFNIVYDRPNRPFLRGKALAAVYMTVGLAAVFTGLVVATLGTDLLQRYASDVVGNRWVALALTSTVSGITLLVFLQSAYFRLTNARMTHREVLPGALLVTVALVATLQTLPLFVHISSGLVALQALGATFLLLVWLWVMANMIVFGSVFNWQLSHGRSGEPARPRHDTAEETSAANTHVADTPAKTSPVGTREPAPAAVSPPLVAAEPPVGSPSPPAR
jgi:membrane protein